jgi:hypothetical protein
MTDLPDRLPYRLLTGPDDRSFCEKVSAALLDGYELHGGPAVAVEGGQVVCAQAVVLRGPVRADVQPL